MPNFLSPGSPARRALGACLVPVLVAAMAPTVTGCGGAALPPPSGPTTPPPSGPPPPAEARPPKPTPDAIWVVFRPELAGQHWSLIGGDEKVLCELPCARWIPDPPSVSIQHEDPDVFGMVRVGLPNDVGPAGGSIIAV